MSIKIVKIHESRRIVIHYADFDALPFHPKPTNFGNFELKVKLALLLTQSEDWIGILSSAIHEKKIFAPIEAVCSS